MTEPSVDSRRGWVVVAAAVLSMFAVFGVGYSFGAFFTSMAEEFNASTGATALVFSLTVGLSFFAAPFTGQWADRVGPKPVLVAGAASMVAGLLLTAITPSLYLGYITYGLGVGFAIACGYVPMVATVGGWFVAKRASALGVAVAGIGLGRLVGLPVAASIIARSSWRTTYLIFAIAGGTMLLLAAFFAERGPGAVPVDRRVPLGQLLRRSWFGHLYVSTVLMTYGIFVPFVFIVRYAEQRSIDPVPAALLVGLIGGASVIGRLGLGVLADRFGSIRLFVASHAVLAASHLIWLFAGASYLALVVYTLVLGVGYGGFIALSPAVTAEYYGVDGLGGVIGSLYTAAGIGSLTGPPIAGFLIDSVGDQAGILLALVTSCLGTAVLTRLITTRPPG